MERHEKVKEQTESLHEEATAVDSEEERLLEAFDQLHDDLKTATDTDAERLEQEADSLKAQVEAFVERRRSVENAVTELEGEVSEVNRLSHELVEQYKTADVEGEKLYFEVYKLIATLATGTIVAVTALTTVPEPEPVGIWKFALAVGLLLSSITGSVTACLYAANRVA